MWKSKWMYVKWRRDAKGKDEGKEDGEEAGGPGEAGEDSPPDG